MYNYDYWNWVHNYHNQYYYNNTLPNIRYVPVGKILDNLHHLYNSIYPTRIIHLYPPKYKSFIHNIILLS